MINICLDKLKPQIIIDIAPNLLSFKFLGRDKSSLKTAIETIIKDLSNVGLLNVSEKGVYTFKTADEIKNSLVKIVDEKAQGRLEHIFNVVNKKNVDC